MSGESVERTEREPPEKVPLHVPDRYEKHVNVGHKANQVLYDVLDKAESIEEVDLMGSHARSEKPNGPRPTYHVWVEFRNEGMGHPIIRDPVQSLIDEGAVKLCSVVECSDDHLIVSLRPIERTVEPVMVEKRDIPERFLDD